MLGFIKNLFRKRSVQEPTSLHEPPRHSSPQETAPSPVQAAAAPHDSNAAPPPIPAAAAIPPARSRSRNKMERVLLPLKTITDAFPEALQPLVAEAPEPTVMIALPVDRIIAQLPKGRVEVAIAQLRRVAPPTIFIAETDWDDQMVEIPLRDLLPKLDPDLMKRRTQRRIDVPLEEDVFHRRPGFVNEEGDDDGLGIALDAPTEEELQLEAAQGATLTPPPAVPPVAPVAPPPIPPLPTTAQSGASLSAPSELKSLFGSTRPTPKTAAPPEPPASAPSIKLETPPSIPMAPATQPAAIPLRSIPPPASKPLPVAARPASIPPPAAPAVQAGAIPLKLSSEEPTLPMPGSSNPLNPQAFAPTPAAPKGNVVLLPLHKIAVHWPESIREEVTGVHADALIEYPLEPLGAALKRGKVTALWRELRSWTPALHDAPSLYDDAVLELPLPVVAPLFMAASGGRQAPVKRTVVDESIPSPFTPNAPAAPPPPEPAAIPLSAAPVPPSTAATPAPPAAPAASAPIAATPTPATPPAPVAEPVVEINTKPMGALGLDEAIPSTLIDRACALSGVAGSVIALKDGLLVAAKTPGEFKAETIAAFLPQVFSRVESAAGSMEIGEFQTLMFTAGDRPWQIWKAGTLFFAAIGKPNELLPSAQLKIIAGQLARQTKA